MFNIITQENISSFTSPSKKIVNTNSLQFLISESNFIDLYNFNNTVKQFGLTPSLKDYALNHNYIKTFFTNDIISEEKIMDKIKQGAKFIWNTFLKILDWLREKITNLFKNNKIEIPKQKTPQDDLNEKIKKCDIRDKPKIKEKVKEIKATDFQEKYNKAFESAEITFYDRKTFDKISSTIYEILVICNMYIRNIHEFVEDYLSRREKVITTPASTILNKIKNLRYDITETQKNEIEIFLTPDKYSVKPNPNLIKKMQKQKLSLFNKEFNDVSSISEKYNKMENYFTTIDNRLKDTQKIVKQIANTTGQNTKVNEEMSAYTRDNNRTDSEIENMNLCNFYLKEFSLYVNATMTVVNNLFGSYKAIIDHKEQIEQKVFNDFMVSDEPLVI